MDGGAGSDYFGWEGTTPGTSTTADGGPGEDRFRARGARGAESISGGPGVDEIDVFDNGSGDRDTVTCGDGVDFLTADASDAVSGRATDAAGRKSRIRRKAFRIVE